MFNFTNCPVSKGCCTNPTCADRCRLEAIEAKPSRDRIEELEAALQSIARWALDDKLSAWERVSIIAHHPSIRAARRAS